MNLEGIRCNGDGYLERWKDMPGGETGPPPRAVAADYGDRYAVYFGSGIDRQVEAALRELPHRTLVDGDPVVFDILSRREPIGQHDQHWTYTVSDVSIMPRCAMAQRLSSRDERLREFSDGFFGIAYDAVFAVIINDAVVSAATSSREDAAAAELWVYTQQEHRRRGYGSQVAVAWLRDAADRGLIPYYSHIRDNDESRLLAQALPLRLCFVVSCYQ